MSFFSKLKNLGGPEPESAEKRKNYKATKVLGTGAFGVVKEAIDLRTNQHVAMKSIKKSGSEEKRERISSMFQREATLLKGIHHPNIVSVLDSFETKEKYYMIFELATGGELFERLSKVGHFTEQDAATIIYQILKGLAALHEKNIVHRDIKPENILYKTDAPDAPVMIADFGVSQMVAEEGELLQTVAGSPGYAAPEVIRKTGHNTSADMWSLGILSYTILGGYHPFHHCQDMSELLDAIVNARVIYHEKFWRLISKRAKHFIWSLLQLNPKDRLTAETAQFHPWILSFCVEAKNKAEELEREATENKKQMLEEAKILASQDQLQEDVVQLAGEGPVNLVKSVWVEGPKFNAKSEWKKALDVIRSVNGMKEAVRTNSVKSSFNNIPLDSEDEV